MQFLTREQLGREIARSEKDLRRRATSWNRLDAVQLALALENALANASYDIRGTIPTSRDDLQVRAAVERHLLVEHDIAMLSIDAVLRNSTRQSSALPEVPPFGFFLIAFNPGFDGNPVGSALDELASRTDLDLRRDFVYAKPTTLARVGLPATRVLWATEARSKGLDQFLTEWLKLLESVRRIGILETAMEANAGVEFGEGDWPSYRYIGLADGEVDRILMSDQTHPAFFNDLMQPHEWGTDFSGVTQQTMAKTHLGKGPINRMLLRKETKSLADGFASFPGFGEAFKSQMTISLQTAIEVIDNLAMLAYPRRNCLLHDRRSRLIVRISKRTALPRSEVERALSALVIDKWSAKDQLLIQVDDLEVVTSFDQAASFLSKLLDHVFSTTYQVNSRGDVFEKRCREAVETAGLRVADGRIKVSRPLLPPEVAVRLWGFQKSQTDIDIVATDQNLVLFIECKEFSLSSPRLAKPRTKMLFDRFLEETYWKANALAQSPDSVISTLGPELLEQLGIDPHKACVVPMLVSNFQIVTPKSGVPLVPYGQLTEFVGGLRDFWSTRPPTERWSEWQGRMSTMSQTFPVVILRVQPQARN